MQHRILLTILGLLAAAVSSMAGIDPQQEFLPGVAVFAVEPDRFVDLRESGSVERLGFPELDDLFERIGAKSVDMAFPFIKDPKPGNTDLRLTYKVYFPDDEPVEQVCAAIGKVDGIRWAEPSYIYQVFYDPNDPQRGNQYNMDLISAAEAHDVGRGSREIVIAITDTGMDMDHPDLAANLYVNPGEDLNGNGVIDGNERNNRDDDGNGKADDFHGWDMSSNDNNMDDSYGHGTHVAGIASAVTDNQTGIASVGFSCALMIVRVGAGPGIDAGYEGIAWAAQNGADVINCSWGGGPAGNGLQVINAATELGAIVVCAAGNNGSRAAMYPAGFPNSFSVAATGRSDQKAGFSNYGTSIDIAAPGVGILSTLVNASYGEMDGTSMASPLVAGAAALFRSVHRDYGPLDVADFLRFSADNIDEENPAYIDLLGGGRLNIANALAIVNQPLVIMNSLQLLRDGNRNRRLDPGEAATITATVGNRGAAPDSIFVELFCEDPDIDVLSGRIACPNIARGETYTNSDQPFNIRVADDCIPHTTRFTAQVTTYPGGQMLESELSLLIGYPSILIVDDDGGVDYQRYMQESIETIRLGYLNWEVTTTQTPTLDTLRRFRLVIWTCGDASSPLTADDQWTIQQGASRGYNILLTGRYIGDDRANNQFLREVFGAQHTQDSVGVTTVQTVPGRNRPTQSVMELLLDGDGGSGDGRVSPSAMTVTREGDSAFVYINEGRITGLAGAYHEDRNTGGKALYAGFTIEAISDDGVPRARLLEKLIGWFCPELSAPPVDGEPPRLMSLEAPYPNPFNGAVSLNYFLDRDVPYSLQIVDATGRSVAELARGDRAGSHRLIWDAAGYPSGVYYARLTAGGNDVSGQRLILLK